MNKHKKKPSLIIIEGPAGVGKTTIQKYLYKAIESRNIPVDILPEFSNNQLGQLIKNHSHYGHDKPDWLAGINGLMLYLSDKIYVIEKARLDLEKIWVCDRFFSTQFILGLKAIRNNEDKLFAKDFIQKVFDRTLKNISEQSVFIFLDSNVEILQRRLEKRINRKLIRTELISLEYEITGYRQLANSLKFINTFVVENNNSVNIIGNKILNIIYSK